MFKIGEFARLNRVSIRTLRYYEKFGLLEPYRIDPETGYRFYSAGQIPRLNRIILLKEIGFSLSEIIDVLDKKLTSEQMSEYLTRKRKELLWEIRKEQLKIDRIDAQLKILRKEKEAMSYDIVLKKIEASKVASVRDIIPKYNAQGPLWEELARVLKDQNIKTVPPSFFAMYHDAGYKENGVDVEVVETVSTFGKDTERVHFKMLPEVRDMVCLIHQGPYERIRNAYNAASCWIEENGYRIAGPQRECYLKGAWDEPDPEKWITELQIPVEKIG